MHLSSWGGELGIQLGTTGVVFLKVTDFDDQSCHFGLLLLNDAHPAYSRVREVFLLLFSIPDEH